jgi:hypothetical protein
MGDDKFGKHGYHGKNYSRKGRYHKNYPKKAEQNKSQVAEKSRVVREKPAVKPTTQVNHLLEFEREHEQAVIRYAIREKRAIYWRKIAMEIMLICMALAIGGSVIRMMLLYGR